LKVQQVWTDFQNLISQVNLAQVGINAFWVAVKIIAVIVIGRLAIILSGRFVDRLVLRQGQHQALFGTERRFQTIAGIVKSIIRYTVDFFAGVTILSLLGIDTSSILLGAGVAGLAVGFGAQNLVRDILTGFFILFEDQFAVGDYVAVGNIDGIVEEMGLRTTHIRAFGGQLHIVPNGKIELVTNFSRGAMRVLFEVEVAYEENTAAVIAKVQEVLDAFAAESEVVVEGPTVLGVSQLGASGVSIMVWAKVKPMEQWAVERELKLRIKQAFDQAGIEIPYPRRVYISGGSLSDRIRAAGPGASPDPHGNQAQSPDHGTRKGE